MERRKALVFHVARPRIAAAFAAATRLCAGVLFGEGHPAFRRSTATFCRRRAALCFTRLPNRERRRSASSWQGSLVTPA